MKELQIGERAWVRVPCSAAPRLSYGPARVERFMTFSLWERLFGHCWVRVDRHDSIRGLRIVRCFTESEYRDYWVASVVESLKPFGLRITQDMLALTRSGVTETEKHRFLTNEVRGDELLLLLAQFMFKVFGSNKSPVQALYAMLLEFVGGATYLEVVKTHILPKKHTDEQAYALIKEQSPLPADAALYRQEEMLQRIFLAAYFKAPLQSKVISQLLRDLTADGGKLSDYPKVVR